MFVLYYQMVSRLHCFCRRDIKQAFIFKLKIFTAWKFHV
jgi:hypothetical protein